jgi:hypothetical protein
MALLHGVNVLALMSPVDIKGLDSVIFDTNEGYDNLFDIDEYHYNLFIDPRGSFSDRARDIAAREKEGAWDVHAALNDLENVWGEKGGLSELHSSIKDLQIEMLKTMREILASEEEQ